MKKPKTLAGSVGAFVVAAVFAVGVTALVTPAADAGPCMCPLDTYQSLGWGMGATCTQAKNACDTDARNNADAKCQSVTGGDSCGFVGTTQYGGCYPFGGQIKVDCHILTRCEECIQFPGE